MWTVACRDRRPLRRRGGRGITLMKDGTYNGASLQDIAGAVIDWGGPCAQCVLQEGLPAPDSDQSQLGEGVHQIEMHSPLANLWHPYPMNSGDRTHRKHSLSLMECIASRSKPFFFAPSPFYGPYCSVVPFPLLERAQTTWASLLSLFQKHVGNDPHIGISFEWQPVIIRLFFSHDTILKRFKGILHMLKLLLLFVMWFSSTCAYSSFNVPTVKFRLWNMIIYGLSAQA